MLFASHLDETALHTHAAKVLCTGKEFNEGCLMDAIRMPQQAALPSMPARPLDPGPQSRCGCAADPAASVTTVGVPHVVRRLQVSIGR
jgi:hypothetical protein